MSKMLVPNKGLNCPVLIIKQFIKYNLHKMCVYMVYCYGFIWICIECAVIYKIPLKFSFGQTIYWSHSFYVALSKIVFI